jgi:hypothetical protein
MKTSEARLKACKINSATSTGPRTPDGRDRSRRNGLKHGMTGQGIVLHQADAAEVERRHQALNAELAPQSVKGAILVGQMATLSVKMERGAKQEFAAVAERVRHASEVFDAERVEKAEQLFKELGDDPRGKLRKLLKLPEGVEVLLDAWHDLRDDLAREFRPGLSQKQGVTMANLLGFRDNQAEVAWVEALTKATWADFNGLAACDGGDLDREGRKAWARARLLEAIDQEIAELDAHYLTLDHATLALDRAEAGDRALFDPSKQACLARRYESEARRGFFKSLKEYYKAETEAVDRLESEPPVSASPPEARLASSCAEPSPGLDEAPIGRMESFLSASQEFSSVDEVVQGADGRSSRIGRAVSVSS